MKRTIYTLLFSIIVIIPVLLGMASPMKMTDAREKKGIIQIETKPNLEIHEGYVSRKKETILVKKGKKTVAKVHLSEPVIVALAEQEEKWGYFQFPIIAKAEDGNLIVSWQMKADSHKTYGKVSDRKYTPMMSDDEGQTWKSWKNDSFALGGNYHVRLDNGEILEIYTPVAKEISNVKSVGRIKEKVFYSIDDVPEYFQGLYFNHWDNNRKAQRIHAKINDPGLLRYAIDGLMPIVWWGSIKQLADHSLMAGIYPGYYKDTLTNKIEETISFYNSTDQGKTWSIIGKIPYSWNVMKNEKGDGIFSEPVYEILRDSSFICVMRTGSGTPMYKAFSYDKGKTWTRPEAFTPNGVRPNLILLGNGVLVLVSGRPGVQIRFCFDGKGREWSEPIDMVPFMHNDGTYSRSTTCGYASVIEADNNSFYLVYSDFTTRNFFGQHRKSIWFRKVTTKISK